MPLVLIILVGVVVSGSATTVTMNVQLYTDVGVDDKVFSQDVIFVQPASSATHCAALCKQQPRCVTFTFDHEVCRGHIMLVTTSTPSTHAPGARSFTRVTWTGTTCDRDSDCSQLQADITCFQGTCVCTPGFYYSNGSATCVTECPSEKLGKSFTKYADHYISQKNDKDWPGVSVEECFDHCIADPKCLSIDYVRTWDPVLCRLCYSVATSEGNQFMSTSGKGFEGDYYQRQCQ